MHGVDEEPEGEEEEMSEDWEMNAADRYNSLMEGEIPEVLVGHDPPPPCPTPL